MVFVGGEPLTFKRAAGVIRGLTHQQFTGVLDDLAARYQRQRRPYALLLRQGSATLTLRPAFLGFRDRLLGGPRETRLTQPMIDVLSLVAYRQPVSGDEVNKIRGAESSGILRQLVRVGLIARSRDGENLYTTTKRFLEVFQLTGLDDLPRPVDPADPED
jgi:chromosome segregation and condensation protein ScpB